MVIEREKGIIYHLVGDYWALKAPSNHQMIDILLPFSIFLSSGRPLRPNPKDDRKIKGEEYPILGLLRALGPYYTPRMGSPPLISILGWPLGP